MTEDFDRLEEEYVRDLVGHFKTHPDWEFEPTLDSLEDQINESAQAIETGAGTEYTFRHTDTDANLNVIIPDLGNPPNAARGTLGQALEPRNDIEPQGDTFGGRLAQAQGEISEKHADGYVTQITDYVSVAGIEVPLDYDPETLGDSLNALSQVSREVAELHSDITAPLERYE